MKNYLEEMKKFISYRSISTDTQYKNDMSQTANYLCDLLKTYGFETKSITWYGNPIVVASYHHDDSLPTCLIYGHYDVQPADISEWWEQDPFDMQTTDEKIIARGAVDNKGQIMIHIISIGEAIQEWTLQYNIKFMIEGDEETGSPYLSKFVKDHTEDLSCDFVMVSDGEIIGEDIPTITAGYRWWANMTVTLQTATVDLHSGIYWWIAPNSAHEANILINKLYDDGYRIAIPGYYDDVSLISQEMIDNNLSVPFDPEDIKKITGMKSLYMIDDYDPVTINGLLPTIQVTWLQSWYTGNWYRNAIPHQTIIKFNLRLAPGQNAQTAVAKFSNWIQETLPTYVDSTIDISDPYEAITIDTDNTYTQKTAKVLEQQYNNKAIFRYCWAAVPVTGLFQEILKAAVVVADLGNEDCNMHGVAENMRLSCIEKGLAFSKAYFSSPAE